MSYITNIKKKTEENITFRTVLFTGEKSQLVIMAILPGEEIGKEKHPHVEQTLIILSGKAEVTLDGVKRDVTTGDAIVVTPGIKHNVINTGSETLKIYTLYAPANHIDGRVHVSKEDADADEEDEKFGHQAPS